MSRRRSHSDLRLALGIRRLQERAALLGLQAQRKAADAARECVDQSILRQQQCEDAWRAAVDRPVLDAGTLGLWRFEADSAIARTERDRRQLETESEAVVERRDHWDRQLRLADALEGLARKAARALYRSDDERRLGVAEDVRLSTRGRS